MFVTLAVLSLGLADTRSALLALRGGNIVRSVTDKAAGIQLIGGVYGYACVCTCHLMTHNKAHARA